jgi:hypothetical protein
MLSDRNKDARIAFSQHALIGLHERREGFTKSFGLASGRRLDLTVI